MNVTIKFLLLKIGNKIVHEENCHLFCKSRNNLCPLCTSFRSTLASRKYRKKHCGLSVPSTDPSSTTVYNVVSQGDMKGRLKNMHGSFRALKKTKGSLG